MGIRRTGWFLPAALFPALLLPFMDGCGGGESDGNASTPAPQVDPRFATPEALLNHYNDVITAGPKVSVEDVLDLFYAESQVQERAINAFRTSIPMIDLEEACWEAFGVGFRSDTEEPPRTPERNRAVMTETESDRAKATHQENDGDVLDIYLVRVGDRWWLSGYTLEYDADINLAATDLDKMERGLAVLAAAAPAVTSEIKSGKWAGAGAQGPTLARLSLLAILQRDHGITPENAEEFFNWTEDE